MSARRPTTASGDMGSLGNGPPNSLAISSADESGPTRRVPTVDNHSRARAAAIVNASSYWPTLTDTSPPPLPIRPGPIGVGGLSKRTEQSSSPIVRKHLYDKSAS